MEGTMEVRAGIQLERVHQYLESRLFFDQRVGVESINGKFYKHRTCRKLERPVEH